MTSTALTQPTVAYIECDIPEGMTLDEWRRRRPRSDAHKIRRAVRRLARHVQL